jgi:hypothetical protein
MVPIFSSLDEALARAAETADGRSRDRADGAVGHG